MNSFVKSVGGVQVLFDQNQDGFWYWTPDNGTNWYSSGSDVPQIDAEIVKLMADNPHIQAQAQATPLTSSYVAHVTAVNDAIARGVPIADAGKFVTNTGTVTPSPTVGTAPMTILGIAIVAAFFMFGGSKKRR